MDQGLLVVKNTDVFNFGTNWKNCAPFRERRDQRHRGWTERLRGYGHRASIPPPWTLVQHRHLGVRR